MALTGTLAQGREGQCLHTPCLGSDSMSSVCQGSLLAWLLQVLPKTSRTPLRSRLPQNTDPPTQSCLHSSLPWPCIGGSVPG